MLCTGTYDSHVINAMYRKDYIQTCIPMHVIYLYDMHMINAMYRKVAAQGPRGVTTQTLAHLRAAAAACSAEDSSPQADLMMPCRIFSVLSGQSCSSMSDVTDCMLSSSSSADVSACAQEWGASALLSLVSREHVGDAMRAEIIRAVLAALLQHAEHPGVSVEGGKVLQAVMNKQDASSVEMDLRLRVLTAMLAVLWVHSNSGEVQEQALKTLQILVCDASLLEKSLDKDVVGMILTSLRNVPCSYLGLQLLHTILCEREDIPGDLIDRIKKHIAFFRGQELIQQCMAAHPTHAEIQNTGDKCLTACAQWFEKVHSQSAEIEKLAIEGLKHQLDLASEANRNKKKGPDSQNPADLLQDAGKTSDVCPEDDSSQLKERIIAQLETQLLPELKQERISWQQAVSILDRLQVDVLQRALQTGVLQPVLAEIRAERASQALQAAADAAQKEQEVAAVGAAQQEQEAAAASQRVARARLAKAKAEAQV